MLSLSTQGNLMGNRMVSNPCKALKPSMCSPFSLSTRVVRTASPFMLSHRRVTLSCERFCPLCCFLAVLCVNLSLTPEVHSSLRHCASCLVFLLFVHTVPCLGSGSDGSGVWLRGRECRSPSGAAGLAQSCSQVSLSPLSLFLLG